MQCSIALLALAGAALANPVPQAVTAQITPTGAAPAGCQTDAPGTYNVLPVKPSGALKRDLHKRATLVVTLRNGILRDAFNTVGYIAANRQFQFDPPSEASTGPQAGAIYTAGWSLCSNGSLALGPSNVFYQCTSGDFKNLYDQAIGEQCDAIALNLVPTSGSSSGGQVTAGASNDGQVTATGAGQLTDGQVTATGAGQLPDGQITASSAGPMVSQIPDGQNQVPSMLGEASDGQPVLPSSGAAGQMTDGQITVATATPTATGGAGQMSDGQITVGTAAPTAGAGQQPDGQVTVGTTSPTVTGAAGQLPDGQVTASSALPVFTGAAGSYHIGSGFAAAIAGVAAVVML